MRHRQAILPLVLMIAAAPPAFAGRGIACDPPLDQPLRLTVKQSFFLADGTATTAVVTRSLRFTRNAEGFLVEARVTGLDTNDAESGALDRLRLAYGAPGDVPVVIRLDAAMSVMRIESFERLWQDFRQRQVMLAGAMGKDGHSNERALSIVKMIDAMSIGERIAVLSAFLKPVLRYCGTVAPMDAQWLTDGTISAEIRADRPDVSDVSQYHIDQHTGLLRTLDHKLASAAAPLRPMREHWSLEKIP